MTLGLQKQENKKKPSTELTIEVVSAGAVTLKGLMSLMPKEAGG